MAQTAKRMTSSQKVSETMETAIISIGYSMSKREVVESEFDLLLASLIKVYIVSVCRVSHRTRN